MDRGSSVGSCGIPTSRPSDRDTLGFRIEYKREPLGGFDPTRTTTADRFTEEIMPTLLLIAFLLAWPDCLFAQRSAAPSPIIDVHLHAVGMFYRPDGTPPPRVCINQVPECGNKPSAFTTDDALLQGTLTLMQRYNIVLGVVSGEESVKVARWLDGAPHRFLGGWMLDGGRSSPRIARLRRAFRSGRYSVLGEITSQYDSRPPDDPALEPYFALAEELDVPVLIHTLGFGAPLPKFRSALGHPLMLEPVIKRHPRLRLYVENAGYPFADEMTALMIQYPQVYADVSTITWIIPRDAFHDYLRTLVRAGLSQRLMFGSDQIIWPETIETSG